MTEEQRAELAAIMHAAVDLANRAHRLQLPSPAAPVPAFPGLPADLIEVGVAARLARRPTDTVRAWCRANPIDAGGFSMKLGGRWFVSRSLFLAHLRR